MPAASANALEPAGIRPADWRRAAKRAFHDDAAALRVCEYLVSKHNAKTRLSPSSPKAISMATGLPYQVASETLKRLERAGAISQLEFADPPIAIRRLCPPGQGPVQVARLIPSWAADALSTPSNSKQGGEKIAM
ncbi:hypothetical protein NKI80_18870 [Mesorhizobium sp. M0387]|uniref:hypothetical protein n=1 Tax=Mesorhizobium sp. M0387 TaxID=2956940 RepID=UPI003334AE65